MNYDDLKKNLKNNYNFNKIPKDLNISTLSACCKLNVNIFIDNIVNYLDLDEHKINELKNNNKNKKWNDKELKPIIYKKKKPPRIFFNQLNIDYNIGNTKNNINN